MPEPEVSGDEVELDGSHSHLPRSGALEARDLNRGQPFHQHAVVDQGREERDISGGPAPARAARRTAVSSRKLRIESPHLANALAGGRTAPGRAGAGRRAAPLRSRSRPPPRRARRRMSASGSQGPAGSRSRRASRGRDRGRGAPDREANATSKTSLSLVVPRAEKRSRAATTLSATISAGDSTRSEAPPAPGAAPLWLVGQDLVALDGQHVGSPRVEGDPQLLAVQPPLRGCGLPECRYPTPREPSPAASERALRVGAPRRDPAAAQNRGLPRSAASQRHDAGRPRPGVPARGTPDVLLKTSRPRSDFSTSDSGTLSSAADSASAFSGLIPGEL